MIDCRSDAITQPTEEMWDAMRSAEVGWAMQGEDPSINALQIRAAEITGMEAAIYVPSGTMANLVALMTHTERGDHVILDAYSHILWSEEWSLGYVCGVVPRPVKAELGQIAATDVEQIVSDERFGHRPRIRLLCLENTHNMAGGTVMPMAQLAAVSQAAHKRRISIHLDGARVLNACAALNVDIREIARHVDTLSINLNKGLSAPGGALLCGGSQAVEQARQNLKRLGGWSVLGKAGPWAAAGLVGLVTMAPRLADDNRRARALAEKLADLEGVEVDLRTVQTNIVMVRLSKRLLPADRFLGRLAQAGVRAYGYLPDTVRFVVHRHVTDGDVAAIVAAARQVTTGS